MLTTSKTHTADPCCCPACTGLATFERPLFATGQTLTASDLTALQSYVAGKNRLHNRYLHGWGVVCGLEVLCDDCEGSVSIHPGYAIDPCGEDIVVGAPTRYDVAAAIRDCAGKGRSRTGDCDPWVPPPDPGCADALAYWCIALKYREVETAVSQRLTTGGSACVTIGKGAAGPSCGCGGSWGCGCGGDGNCGCQGAKASTSYAPNTIVASNSCAPRRVKECFDIVLIPSDEPCGPQLKNFRGSMREDKNPLGLIGWLIPEKSLLRNIIDCVLKDIKALTDGLSDDEGQILAALATTEPAALAASTLTLDDTHAAVCKLRGLVLGLLQGDAGTTRCQMLRAVAEATLAPPTRGNDAMGIPADDRATYFARAKQVLLDLLAAWLQLVLDCICRAFLPRCEDDACDDRVELACITVKQGKIIDICNHSCRRYAGAFPSTFYWMSLIPIVPLIARMLAMVCCQPALLRKNSPLVNDLVPLLATVDPSGRLARAITDDDFALPRRLVGMAAKFAETPVVPALAARLNATSAENYAPGKPRSTSAVEGSETAALRQDVAALREELTALARKCEARPAAKPRKPAKPK
ncbi:hypothetical protein [Alteraurantiacibacter aquimixticola]|uniref:Uncharacterized protein n=1 Tax=Alteraurantiacibacter aquimixticola TaxID=2489173 RepID=A0A4T3EYE2_9SPHN|nr:hypothetical protein [Alteraurantiacibacter aquimixticola]TIX49626.1 hypothetical protein E5222_12405 [Alteraurantiacibacter aquimixticola]